MAIGSGWTVTSFQRVVLQTTTTTTKFSRCPITNPTRPLADYPLESKDYISNYPIGYILYSAQYIEALKSTARNSFFFVWTSCDILLHSTVVSRTRTDTPPSDWTAKQHPKVSR